MGLFVRNPVRVVTRSTRHARTQRLHMSATEPYFNLKHSTSPIVSPVSITWLLTLSIVLSAILVLRTLYLVRHA